MPPRIKVAGSDVRWQTLPELLSDSAAMGAADAGVEIDGRFMSYRDLELAARKFANNLAMRGIGRGDRVCSLMHNRVESLITWFGAAMRGAIWVPINIGLIGQDLAHIVADADPALLIVDDVLLERLQSAQVSVRLPAPRFLLGAHIPPEGFESFEKLLSDGPPHMAPDIAPCDPAVIIYTGGTTGLPKGVVLPHFAMIAGAMRYVEAFGATPADRHFGVSPLYHAGGLTISVLGPMMARMRTTIDRTFSVTHYWRRVRESAATIINPIGVILTLLCRQTPSDFDRRHNVRICIGVTGQLPDEIPREFSRRFGIEIVNIYALTEASGAMIVYNERNSPRPDANGRSSNWVEVAVVDAFDQKLAPHQVGEIVLRPMTPFNFMLGYHNNDSGALKVTSNLWLHTGDLGYLDELGYLYFRGREAHWLRRRGENISAYEVESVISQYPGVADLAIVGVPAEIGEEDVKLFIVPEPGVAFDPVELVYWCDGRMAAFKVPRFIEVIAALPRSTAKREVERHVLRSMPNDCAWDREIHFGRGLPKRPTPAA